MRFKPRFTTDIRIDYYRSGTHKTAFIPEPTQAAVHADNTVRPRTPPVRYLLMAIVWAVAWLLNAPSICMGQAGSAVELAREERVWLAQGHTVRVLFGDYPPNCFFEDGTPAGIAIDLLNVVSNRTGVKFYFAPRSGTWKESLDGLARHSGPDLLPSIQSTPEREKHMLFTEAYLAHPKFIFTRDDAPFVSSIEDLSGKSVAVENNYVVRKLLEQKHPDIDLMAYDTSQQALEAVSSGSAFAYIGPIRPVAVMINRCGFGNLKAAAPSALPDNVVRMGIRNDWPELRSIIDKVLAAMPVEEKTAIVSRWTPIRFEHGIGPGDVLKWGLGGVCATFIIVCFFLFWNRTLTKKVAERTSELKRSTESLEAEIEKKNRTERALIESRRFTDNLIETANVMIVGLDATGSVTLFNPAAERITGYTLADLQEKNWFDLLVPKERYPEVHAEFIRLMAGGLPRLFQNPIVTKSGKERFVSWSNNEIRGDGRIIGTLSFGIDVTERKRAEEALGESEERFRYLVEQSPLSIQVFNLDGRLVRVNEAWQAMWGFSNTQVNEILGKYNVLEDREAGRIGILPFIEKAFNGDGVTLPVVEYDASITRSDLNVAGDEGNKRWVHARFYPIKNSAGKVVNVISIEEDVTERMEAEREIRQYQDRLKALAAQLTLAEERERRRIAADLHDQVGQSLAFARIGLASVKKQVSEDRLTALLDDISGALLTAVQDTRHLIFDLSPPQMNEIGLSAAIGEWLAQEIENRHGIKTELVVTGLKKRLDDDVRAILFRNVRELLVNVVKHAGARKVSVVIEHGDAVLTVSVRDDGVGVDLGAVSQAGEPGDGFGLFSIRERMNDLGGSLAIDSEPKKGFTAIMTLPRKEG